MKKGKLSKAETASIRGMLAADIELEEIASQLDRSLVVVKKAVASLSEEPVATEEVASPHDASYFINKTAGGREGISVMTEAASQRGDVARNVPAPTVAKPWIHKIKDGKK